MVQTEAHAGLPEKESGRVYIGVLHTHGAVARERHVLANGQISLSRPDELGRFRAIAAEWDLKSGYLDLLIVTGGGGFVQGIPFAETYREWLIQRNNNPEKIFAVTTGSETRSDMRAAARLIKNDLKLPMSRIIVYSDMRHYPEAVGELTRMGVQPMGGPVERLVTERWRNFGLRLAARGQIEGAKAFGKFSEAVYDNIYSPAYHAEMDRRAMGLMSINLINRLTIIQPGNIPIGDRILEAAMRWQRRNRG